MMVETKPLPDNVDTLKEMVIELRSELKEERFNSLVLEEKLKILQKKFFGRKSEKLPEDNGQPLLFDEAEHGCDEIVDNKSEKQEEITIKSHTRKKKRKPTFPEHLPVKEEIHDLSEEEKKCPCCGKERPCIGNQETKEIDIIPEQIQVIKHIQKKYGPCDCEDFKNNEEPEIVTAKKPKRLIPGAIASVGLLAYIFISKFLDSLPFYRQESRFKRLGIEISRTNMCNWTISVSRKCQDLLSLMWKEVRAGPLIQMDETGCHVLKEPGRSPQSKGYMFVTIGYTKKHSPIIIYNYHRTRNKKIVVDILKGFKGYLQTDGLNIYNENDLNDVICIACGSHIRRYFVDAAAISKKKDGIANIALEYFKEIFKIESKLRDELKEYKLTREDFVDKRRKLVEPILENLHKYLTEKQVEVPPEMKIGEAISYALKEWKYWIRYLNEWYLTPDNNYTERMVKPFVIGRKNWYFNDTLRGAYASSTLFSIIQTAKENGLNVYWYLRYLFTKLPEVETEENLRKLLPTEIEPEELLAWSKE